MVIVSHRPIKSISLQESCKDHVLSVTAADKILSCVIALSVHLIDKPLVPPRAPSCSTLESSSPRPNSLPTPVSPIWNNHVAATLDCPRWRSLTLTSRASARTSRECPGASKDNDGLASVLTCVMPVISGRRLRLSHRAPSSIQRSSLVRPMIRWFASCCLPCPIQLRWLDAS